MNEHPILFNGDMVRAILEGRKTQIRRPVKFVGGQPASYTGVIIDSTNTNSIGKHRFIHANGAAEHIRCPFGKPGDLLWVRETWAEPDSLVTGDGRCVLYRADANEDGYTVPYLVSNAGGFGGRVGEAIIGKWQPSIHMQRWASRITLRVKSVHIERVQDITEDDAKAEGVKCIPFSECELIPNSEFCSVGKMTYIANLDTPMYRSGFFKTWESVYNNWNANPLVWVVEFERVEHTK